MIISHVLPPCAVGSRHADVVQKFHCLVHSLWLEVGPDIQDVVDMLGNVVAITSDFGTESHLADLGTVDIKDMLPWVQQYNADGEDAVPPPPPPPFVSGIAPVLRGCFRRAVLIPGMNHIAHNISGQIAATLSQYGWWLDRLKAIAHMLSHPGYNDRFRKTCLQDDPLLRPLLPLVKTGVDTLIEWRWGSVVETAHGVESLRGALEYWDLHKFNFKNSNGAADDFIPGDGGGEVDGDGAGDGVAGAQDRGARRKAACDTTLIGEAVKSVYWWVYLSMVMFAEDIMVAVRAFAMSCPCHKLTATTKYMRSHLLTYSCLLVCLLTCILPYFMSGRSSRKKLLVRNQ